MDTIETPRTGVIRAKFNYIVDTGTPPVRYIDWPEMAHKAIDPVYEQRDMPVHDGRPLRATFDLDTHGFVLADHVTQVKDFTSEAERKNVYDAEVQALIKRCSGAAEVFDELVRLCPDNVELRVKAAAARAAADRLRR